MTRKRLDDKVKEKLEQTLGNAADEQESQSSQIAESPQTKINRQMEGLMGRDLTRLLNTNSWRAKYMKSTYKNLVNDLGGGDMMSTAEHEVARRCAALAVIGAEMEQALLVYDDHSFDIEAYLLLARTQAQLFRNIGYKRRARKVGTGPQNLAEFIKSKKAKSRESSDDVVDAVEVNEE